MKLKNSYFSTLRENVKDEETVSGNLLTRSGMIKKTSSGIYMYLPLGYKVIKNIENIIKEEMENISCSEVLMPDLLIDEEEKDTDSYNLFRLKDRYDKNYYLANNHDKLFKEAASFKIKSYKDLPFKMYQISSKFRDEEKIRYGLIRQRQFLMKDAYSFDIDEQGLNNSYDEMYNAYKKVFTRLGINYEIVKSRTSSKNGIEAEEFQGVTDIKEDVIVKCESCGYCANSKIAMCNTITNKSDEELKIRELVKTPNIGSIDEVSSYLDVDKDKIVKTLIYNIDDEFYACLVKGTNEVNEEKLIKLLGKEHISLASEEDVMNITEAEIGFAGPVGIKCPVIVDNEILNMKNFVVGANKTNYHYINVNLEDFNYFKTGDIRLITKEDMCPLCGKELTFKNGVEIGNTFKIGSSNNITYLDKENENKNVWIGFYAIGISRCLATIVEQHHDDNGIIWPIEVAPFKVSIVVLNTQDQVQMDAANYLYNELRKNNIPTILDDRDDRIGVKFNDMDLIGIPIRVTIGNKINDDLVEIKERKKEEYIEISLYDALTKIEDIIEVYE